MTTAFETTKEDLETVLEKYGKKLTDKQLEDLFDGIISEETDRIESAALAAETTNDDGETLANQTKAAHEEIATILYEENELPEAVICKICGKLTPGHTAHRHQGHLIGDECCWDERLRASE